MAGTGAREMMAKYAPFAWWVVWFLCAWIVGVTYAGRWPQVAAEWEIALAMAVGSYVAGSTPMGGGTIGFPILVLLFGEPVSLGRNFSFLIQSVGMCSAAVYILCSRQPLAVRPLLWCMATATVVVPVGHRLLAPIVPDSAVKLVFAVIWAGFGVVTLVKLKDLLHTHRAARLPARIDAAVGIGVGIIGGCAAALTGVGIDMVLYCVLVLLYRCDLRIAVASSVIMMAWASLVGSLDAAALGVLNAEVLGKWLAAAPVVLLGAPLGCLMLHVIHRGGTLVFVSILCLGQFFWTLHNVGPTFWTVTLSVGAVLAMNACFHVLFTWGKRRIAAGGPATGPPGTPG